MPNRKGKSTATLLTTLVAVALYLSGMLESLGYRLSDLTYLTFMRPPTDRIAVVEIDALTLRNLGAWPFPRTYHARVVDNLSSAGAEAIVVDLDLSAPSTPEEDQAFAETLARTPGLVTLPVFHQYSSLADTESNMIIETMPLRAFLPYVRIGSANVRPASDGLVRAFAPTQLRGPEATPTLAAILAEPAAALENFLIDYGISIEQIHRISYFDALVGNFDPRLIAGRRIIVAAVAVELGDIAPVPYYHALPGGYVQVLAAESILQDRTLTPAPPAAMVIGIVAIVLAGRHLIRRLSWQAGLAGTAATVLALLAAAFFSYWQFAILLDAAPLMAAIIIAFVSVIISRVDEQTIELIAQTIDLRQRNAFIRRVAEHAFDGLITTTHSGHVLFFSKSAERIFGMTAEQAKSLTIRQLCDLSEDMPGLSMPDGVGQQTDSQHFETTGRRSDGTEIYLDMAITSVDEGGSTTFIFVIRDITNQKVAEAREAASRQRLADAVESSPGGFALFDDNDRLVLCNTRFRKFFSPISANLVTGAYIHELVATYVRTAGLNHRWARRLRLSWLKSWTSKDLRLDDGTVVALFRRTLKDRGTVIVATDITASRRREAELRAAKHNAERANAAKGDFLAMISHELRTPLNAVIGFSEIIAEQPFGPLGDSRYEEYAKNIDLSGRHLLSLINQILEFSKIGGGHRELDEDLVDFASLIRRPTQILGPQLDAKEHQLIVNIDPTIGAVFLDYDLISRAVLNLVSNAIKFTPDRGRIEVHGRRDTDGNLCITVSDTALVSRRKTSTARLNRSSRSTAHCPENTKGRVSVSRLRDQ